MKIPALPTFALVGQPNEGKTTVMATLAEYDAARIGDLPGTTTKAVRYPYMIDGRELVTYWDTPGFQSPEAVLDWLEIHRDETGLAARFLDEHRNDSTFSSECEIFKPLSMGAAAIYIVDASRPVKEIDKYEIEILRLLCVPRIGIINSKGNSRFFDDWQAVMSRDFNLRIEFNGHHAMFRDRLELMQAVRAVIPEWRESIDKAITCVQADWESRVSDVAGSIIEGVRDLLDMKISRVVHKTWDTEKTKRMAEEELKKKVRTLEENIRKKIRSTFRHHSNHWQMEDMLSLDLFSEEVMTVLGLTTKQFTMMGAFAGAAAGGVLDASVGGASFLTGTVGGFVAGGVSGWYLANKGIEIRLPDTPVKRFLPGRVQLSRNEITARVLPQSQIPWVFIDRLLLYAKSATEWSHGRRDLKEQVLDSKSFTHMWERQEQQKIKLLLQMISKKQTFGNKWEETMRSVYELLKDKINKLIV